MTLCTAHVAGEFKSPEGAPNSADAKHVTDQAEVTFRSMHYSVEMVEMPVSDSYRARCIISSRYGYVEKYAARKVKLEISRILWEIWDPIGVNTIPEARDEYDSYVNEVFIMLIGESSDDEKLGEHLLRIATVTMGLSGPTLERMMPTVQALRAIRVPAETE